MAQAMKVNKKHYYFCVRAMGRIEDAHFADYRDKYERERVMKAVWDSNFKLYNETENILKKIEDPYCTLFPLYRWLGQDDEDYIFETREEAEKEYIDQINTSIANRLYDL